MDWIEKLTAIFQDHGLRLEESRVRYLIDELHPPHSLLQCVDCRNTESCAGAMAREFNKGRCLHCGGFFMVIRS
jgi:hypothetical protein